MANFQKDGLWIQGGQGLLANVSEDAPYVPGQIGKVMSVKSTDNKVPRFYQYVQRYTTETAAAANGQQAYWQDIDDFVVTADSATAIGGTTNPLVAGVWLGTSPAAGKYGYVQCAGVATVKVTDTVAAGDLLVPANNTQLKTHTTNALGNIPPVAVALSAVATSTNSTISALLRVNRNGW